VSHAGERKKNECVGYSGKIKFRLESENEETEFVVVLCLRLRGDSGGCFIFLSLFIFTERETQEKRRKSRKCCQRELNVCLFLLTELLLQQDSILFFLVFIYKNWFS
jgi:hypothetical protein